MLKSAVWLLQLAGAATAILSLLAVVAFVVYILVAHPAWAWPLPIAIALGTAVCIGVLGDIIWGLMEKRPVPRAYQARTIGKALLSVSGAVVLFVAIGRLYGWSHGAIHDGLLWTGCLCLGVGSAYRLTREHGVVVALRAKLGLHV